MFFDFKLIGNAFGCHVCAEERMLSALVSEGAGTDRETETVERGLPYIWSQIGWFEVGCKTLYSAIFYFMSFEVCGREGR